MQQASAHLPDWRDPSAYTALLPADRSLFAWEWLRRDPAYRDSAGRSSSGKPCRPALPFGLVAFERPNNAVPHARPVWAASAWPSVLAVAIAGTGAPGDLFDARDMGSLSCLVRSASAEHLLLSDGTRAIRLDGPLGAFTSGPVMLSCKLEGLASAEPRILAFRRLLALCRSGHFGRGLHPPETRAARWIEQLRAYDALAAGANQRDVAEALLRPSVREPAWRDREPSVRSRVQRLVRSARLMAAGGWRVLLR